MIVDWWWFRASLMMEPKGSHVLKLCHDLCVFFLISRQCEHKPPRGYIFECNAYVHETMSTRVRGSVRSNKRSLSVNQFMKRRSCVARSDQGEVNKKPFILKIKLISQLHKTLVKSPHSLSSSKMAIAIAMSNEQRAVLIRAAACAHALSTTRIHSEQCLLV